MWRRANVPYGAEEGPAPDDPAAEPAAGVEGGGASILHVYVVFKLYSRFMKTMKSYIQIHEYYGKYTFKFMNTMAL